MVLVADTDSRARRDQLQVQSRGVVEVGDNLDHVAGHTEVTLFGSLHLKSIFDVFVDTVCFVGRVAFAVGRDNTELELLEVLVAADATNQDIVIELLGDHAVEVPALELEGFVLLHVAAGEALVAKVAATVIGYEY